MNNFYSTPRSESQRKSRDRYFSTLCLLVSSLVVMTLAVLLLSIFATGGSWLSWDFLLANHLEDNPEQSGIRQAIFGSMVLCLLCAISALPIGIGTAIFLEEFQPTGKFLRALHWLVQLNINNLAGVPSIVYGILGVTTFVYMFSCFPLITPNDPPSREIGAVYRYQMKTLGGDFVNFPCLDKNDDSFRITEPLEAVNSKGKTFTVNLVDSRSAAPKNDPVLLNQTIVKGKRPSRYAVKSFFYLHLPFGKTVLSAGLTLGLVILPIVIIASQEALRAVPASLREAALGMGATRWEAVREVVLPAATPGFMTGAILAMSRAVGEAAPVLAVMGGVLVTTNGLTNLMAKTPVLPVTIYKWAGDENVGFEHLAAAAIIVLLVLLLAMNSVAILIRNRYEKMLG
jgi:phosphate transport system permease protein